MSREAIGDRLYALRRVLNLPQILISEEVGLPVYTWNAVERGRSNISWQYAAMIAEATGISLDYFYRGKFEAMDPDLVVKLKKELRLIETKNGGTPGKAWAKRDSDIHDEHQLKLLAQRRELLKEHMKEWRNQVKHRLLKPPKKKSK